VDRRRLGGQVEGGAVGGIGREVVGARLGQPVDDLPQGDRGGELGGVHRGDLVQ